MISIVKNGNSVEITKEHQMFVFPLGKLEAIAEADSVSLRLLASRRNIISGHYSEFGADSLESALALVKENIN